MYYTFSSGSFRTHVCVYRLKPFTSYKFRMLATNDVGDSVLSKETEPVTTLQDGERLGHGRSRGAERKWNNLAEKNCEGMGGRLSCLCAFLLLLLLPHSFLFSRVFSPVPDEPPVILAVKPTTTTSVLVQWKVLSYALRRTNTNTHDKTLSAGYSLTAEEIIIVLLK